MTSYDNLSPSHTLSLSETLSVKCGFYSFEIPVGELIPGTNFFLTNKTESVDETEVLRLGLLASLLSLGTKCDLFSSIGYFIRENRIS